MAQEDHILTIWHCATIISLEFRLGKGVKWYKSYKGWLCSLGFPQMNSSHYKSAGSVFNSLCVTFIVGLLVKQPFFDPLSEDMLYDDKAFWEVSRLAG